MWRCVCVPLRPPCPCRGHLPELGPVGCREGDWVPDRNHSFALLSPGLEENEACFPFLPNGKRRIDLPSFSPFSLETSFWAVDVQAVRARCTNVSQTAFAFEKRS